MPKLSEQGEMIKQLKGLHVPRADRDLPSGLIIAFAHSLSVPAGIHVHQPLRLKPFQIEFIRDVYNPVRPDGRRQRRQGVLSVARRNGKTLLAAVLILCHLVGPLKKPNSHIVSGATTRKQATLVFQMCQQIVMASPTLARHVKVVESTKRIVHRVDHSYYEAIAAEAGAQFGMGLDFVVYDELAQAKDRRLYNTLMTSLGSQEEGLMVIISTQAAADQHVMSELVDYGLKLRGSVHNGKRTEGPIDDPAFTCHLYEHPKELDINDQRGWKLANPGLGDYRDRDELRTMIERAALLPSEEAAVRNLYLNQRVQAEQPFLSPGVYDGRGNALPPNRDLFLDGRPVHGALDLSARTDLTAMVLACEDDEANVHLLPYAWTPRDTLLAREARDRAPYSAWVSQELLRETPGATVDYDFVASDVLSITAGMNLVRLEYDPWRMDVLSAAFARLGAMPPLMKRPQTYQFMSPCIEAFEELALAGKLRHGGSPILRWCFANTVIHRNDQGDRRLSKRRSYGRIDLAQAGVMAVGSMKVGPPAIEIAALIA